MKDVEQRRSEFWHELRIRFGSGLAGLADKGSLIPASLLRDRRGLTAEQLKTAEREGRIISISSPDGEVYYPSCFGDQSLVESADAVMQELKELGWFEKWTFLTQPAHVLNGRSPSGALADGDLDQVLRAAEAARLKFAGR